MIIKINTIGYCNILILLFCYEQKSFLYNNNNNIHQPNATRTTITIYQASSDALTELITEPEEP